ncbi:MAG: hypothetical protein O3B21_07125 [Proteobacteria bacterium]|nr:hypothetical protein [Pseudomonadota bacterium]MDA1356865.1 hypothetical protein [Pseudomonadota bacterium]
MTPPIVSSTFDIAHWFLQRGEFEGIFVSPLKLQRLLYLAQARYAGQHDGAPLMPSVFVVSEVGPLEPNLHRAIEHEPPKVSVHDLPENIMAFVESIWRTFGTREIEALNRLAMQDLAFKETERVSGVAAIIDLDVMCRHHTPNKKALPLDKIPDRMPDDVPDFIADIISAARDEADRTGAREEVADTGRDRPTVPWIPGLAAGISRS